MPNKKQKKEVPDRNLTDDNLLDVKQSSDSSINENKVDDNNYLSDSIVPKKRSTKKKNTVLSNDETLDSNVKKNKKSPEINDNVDEELKPKISKKKKNNDFDEVELYRLRKESKSSSSSDNSNMYILGAIGVAAAYYFTQVRPFMNQ